MRGYPTDTKPDREKSSLEGENVRDKACEEVRESVAMKREERESKTEIRRTIALRDQGGSSIGKVGRGGCGRLVSLRMLGDHPTTFIPSQLTQHHPRGPKARPEL